MACSMNIADLELVMSNVASSVMGTVPGLDPYQDPLRPYPDIAAPHANAGNSSDIVQVHQDDTGYICILKHDSTGYFAGSNDPVEHLYLTQADTWGSGEGFGKGVSISGDFVGHPNIVENSCLCLLSGQLTARYPMAPKRSRTLGSRPDGTEGHAFPVDAMQTLKAEEDSHEIKELYSCAESIVTEEECNTAPHVATRESTSALESEIEILKVEERRRRNREASSRFYYKKKAHLQEFERSLQELKVYKQDLVKKERKLKAERRALKRMISGKLTKRASKCSS